MEEKLVNKKELEQLMMELAELKNETIHFIHELLQSETYIDDLDRLTSLTQGLPYRTRLKVLIAAGDHNERVANGLPIEKIELPTYQPIPDIKEQEMKGKEEIYPEEIKNLFAKHQVNGDPYIDFNQLNLEFKHLISKYGKMEKLESMILFLMSNPEIGERIKRNSKILQQLFLLSDTATVKEVFEFGTSKGLKIEDLLNRPDYLCSSQELPVYKLIREIEGKGVRLITPSYEQLKERVHFFEKLQIPVQDIFNNPNIFEFKNLNRIKKNHSWAKFYEFYSENDLMEHRVKQAMYSSLRASDFAMLSDLYIELIGHSYLVNNPTKLVSSKREYLEKIYHYKKHHPDYDFKTKGVPSSISDQYHLTSQDKEQSNFATTINNQSIYASYMNDEELEQQVDFDPSYVDSILKQYHIDNTFYLMPGENKSTITISQYKVVRVLDYLLTHMPDLELHDKISFQDVLLFACTYHSIMDQNDYISVFKSINQHFNECKKGDELDALSFRPRQP